MPDKLQDAEKLAIIMTHLKEVYKPVKTLSGTTGPLVSDETLNHIAKTHLQNFDKKTSIYQNNLYHK